MEHKPATTPQPNELRAVAMRKTWLRPLASIDDPEPRVAVLLAAPCGGSIATGWLITDGEDSVLESRFAQHFMDECSGVEAALGRAAEEIIENWLADGEKTYVYTNNSAVRDVLHTLTDYLPNLLVLDAPGPRTSRLSHALSLELRDYRTEISATLTPTTIATDASVQLGRAGVGIGGVTADGRYYAKFYEQSTDILVGELLAIRDALTFFSDPVVTLLSDNKKAVALVKEVIGTDTNLPMLHRKTSVVKVLREIRSAATDRQVEIDWVRAHVGHVLNEGADRLAVAARRAARSKLSMRERTVIFTQIMNDVTADLADSQQ